MFYGFVITEAGNQMLAKMVAGDTLELSGVFMDLGTVEDKETARQLTAPIEPGPAGTSTVPTVKGNQVGMIVQFRSDLDGGLKADKWIGGFGVYAKDPDTGDPVMIYYASLGNQKQPIAAYVEGTAPDVRNFPISIRVTSGVDATLTYPAGAWMTAEDVLEYFDDSIKPQLEASLAGLIEAHNESETAHPDIREALEEALEDHNEDPEAHPDIREDIQANAEAILAVTKTANTAKTMADEALAAAEVAAKEVSTITHTISLVPSQHDSLTYTGSAQSPAWSNYNPETLTLGGDTSKTAAGTYTATFTPKEGYHWSGGGTEAKSVTWTIGRAVIVGTPAQSGSLTYTGSAQSPVWSGYDAAKLTLGGTTSGTNAGSYNATFTPGANYQWNDGTTAAKTVPWTIGKAAGSLTLSRTGMTLGVSIMSSTISVTRPGNGAVSATSSNISVATVSVSGTTVTVAARAAGSATITVKVAADANHTAPENKTCSVVVRLPTVNLNDNSWAMIKEVSDVGQGANYWSVGDTKQIIINGEVGNSTFNNLAIDAFIIGFNHNASREGAGRIHFQIGKIGGKDVALCDSKCGNSAKDQQGYFNMCPSNNTHGGWEGCYMRNDLLGNSGSPASTPAKSLLAALPADLRAVMKPVTKYSNNAGGKNGIGDIDADVTATTDYLFLPAEFEVWGEKKFANKAEKTYLLQYDYYKAGNTKARYNHGDTGKAVLQWLRSIQTNARIAAYFCALSMNGDATGNNACYCYGIAPCYTV